MARHAYNKRDFYCVSNWYNKSLAVLYHRNYVPMTPKHSADIAVRREFCRRNADRAGEARKRKLSVIGNYVLRRKTLRRDRRVHGGMRT